VTQSEITSLTENLTEDGKLSAAEESLIVDAISADGNISNSEVANLVDSLTEDGKLTVAEKEFVADVLIEQADGEAISSENIEAAGLTYEDLPDETPVDVRTDENGNEVVITAEVAAALEVLASPVELLSTMFDDPAQALLAIGSIGADMSTEEREEATDMVVATVVAAGAAMNAVGAAAAGAAGGSSSGGSGGGGSSGGGGPSGDSKGSKGVRRRKP
jgi:polyhydroxyalkanoate synthesis regulator phasin